MLVGSLVHLMIDHEVKAGNGPIKECPVFWDDECEWTPPDEAIDEAWRVYRDWAKIRKGWDGRKPISSELLLKAELAPGIHVSALIDWLGYDEDGVLVLEDFKTAGRSGDIHSRGRTRLQLQLYTMCAWANNYDVQKIQVRQIVKTKEVKEELFTIDLPTFTREDLILRYLQGAKSREALGELGPRGAECDFCPFSSEFGNSLCRL